MSITPDVPVVAEPAAEPVADPVAERLADESLAWHRLSRTDAARGESRDAVLSMWASDLRALHLLLWENGIGAAPDAETHVQAFAAAVQAGLRAQAAELATAPTPRLLIEGARRAVAGVFDASVHGLLAERFLPLDHLDAAHPAPFAATGDPDRMAPDRLAGRTPAQLLGDLREAAADCVTVAHALAGDVEEANRQLWQGALASYEAHLVRAAIDLGDSRLTTVGLRWQLAAQALEHDPEAGSGHAWWLRERLLGLPGEESAALAAEFALAGEWP